MRRIGWGTSGSLHGLASVGHVLAVYAESFSSDDPLSGLKLGERPDFEP